MDSSFVSFKNMHIPSREKLHLKTKEQSSTSSTNANLYCEDGTTLDQPTQIIVKPRNTQTVPFPRVSQETAVQLRRTMANTPRHMDFILCVESQPCKEIFGNLIQTSINIMRLETLTQPWGTKAYSALGYPKLCPCHGATKAGRAEQFSR